MSNFTIDVLACIAFFLFGIAVMVALPDTVDVDIVKDIPVCTSVSVDSEGRYIYNIDLGDDRLRVTGSTVQTLQVGEVQFINQ